MCCAHARSFGICAAGFIGDEPRLRVGVGSTEILSLWTHKAGPGGSSREAAPPSTHNNFFQAELNSRTYENRACAYARAPSTSVRPSPVSSNPPACHFASRRVSCVAAKAAHGRGGSRIAIFITARGSGATRARHLARRCHQSWRCHFRLRGACQRLFVARLI